jgi:glycerate kinase
VLFIFELDMRIVCAPNAFKESLSAIEAGIAMQAGIARAARQFSFPVQCQIVPMADGGDGSLDTLVDSTPNSWRVAVEVCDALGRPITADYGVLDHGRVAVIEMARASGLWRIAPHERDATRTSTFGTGQLLLHALENLTDLKRVVMCIGGSLR